MKIQNLDRKIIFILSQKLNSLYQGEKISYDVFLRLVYYYFLSSKQITHIFKELNFMISKEDIEVTNKLHLFKSYENTDSLRFKQIKEKVEQSIGYFFPIDDLHIFIGTKIYNEKTNVIDMNYFINNVLGYISEVLTPKMTNFNFNEFFVYDDKILKSMLSIFKELEYILIREVDKISQDITIDQEEIYSFLFDYLMINAGLRMDFISIPYISDFLIDIAKNIFKYKEEEVNFDSIQFISKFNLGIISHLEQESDFSKGYYYLNKNLTKLEIDFINFTASLTSNHSTLLNNIQDNIVSADLILGQEFKPKLIDFQETKFFTIDYHDLAKKIYSEYLLLLQTIDLMHDEAVGIVLIPVNSLQKSTANLLKIKEFLIKNNYISSIVFLPSGIIENNVSNVAMIILEKNKTTTDIQFINAYLDYKKNEKLKYMDSVHTVNIGKLISRPKETEGISKIISQEEIIDNNYNLNPDEYIEIHKNSLKKNLTVKKLLADLEKEKMEIKNLIRKMHKKH